MLKVALAVAFLLLIGVAATASISGSEEPDESDRISMDVLGDRIARTWQSDLRDLQRKRGLDGTIRVVGADCAPEPRWRFSCLAHVAATREARRVAPAHITITGRRGAGGGWVARERK